MTPARKKINRALNDRWKKDRRFRRFVHDGPLYFFHEAKTRTFRSTLPVAITHRTLSFPPGSSFFPGSELTTAGALTAPGAQRTQLTKCACASSSVLTHLHSCARSQQRIVLSSPTLRRYLPPGWKTSPRTQLSWPTRVLINVPRESQILMLLSRDPVARNSPELLGGGGFLRPAKVARWLYEAAGAKVQHSITCSWPRKVAFASPEVASHNRAIWSSPADNSQRPSKLGATSRTQSV